MGKRGTVTDYGGDEIYSGDLIAYATRRGNGVRLSDAVVLKVTTRTMFGRVIPFLLVRPTGNESGFVRRKTQRAVWVAANHVRLVLPAEAL
ncbi:hypothetical protein [Streptomyces sp. WI03-4A]|uniref:hypothetical protein n=1 Tax=Streptomyces sp. WI03-4A TaxID=3028706 RepID=UPI0029BD820D|nr:hypothetical protein [Streptomyces sp. WI03-4A]MDX2590969.1 hypothetical protein [Streptomyces sp. WI03-4A]